MDFHQESESVQKSLVVLAKFGYLRREFFWNYLSANSRSCKFRSWKILLATGCLEPYRRSFIGEDVYKLSKRGKRILANAGIKPLSAAHPLHFEHDDNVVHFALANERAGAIEASWLSEKALRQMPEQELIKVFTVRPEKLPDLVFDIKLNRGYLRVALEIERTRKSPLRYDTFVNAYSRASGIGLVLVAYNDRSVFESIKASVRRQFYPQSQRPIGFCKISELHKTWTKFPLILGERTLGFDQYIGNLRKMSEQTESDFMSETVLLERGRAETASP